MVGGGWVILGRLVGLNKVWVQWSGGLGIFRCSMQGEESGEGRAGVGNNLQIPQLIMNERPLDGLTTLGVRCGKWPEEAIDS